ncbi:MAG: hypothetical protein D6731_22045 [Planctomycetota bacterium]|nr:MAG: hypothetical protein D6731_22045 [Planctomycetota bacterium]
MPDLAETAPDPRALRRALPGRLAGALRGRRAAARPPSPRLRGRSAASRGAGEDRLLQLPGPDPRPLTERGAAKRTTLPPCPSPSPGSRLPPLVAAAAAWALPALALLGVACSLAASGVRFVRHRLLDAFAERIDTAHAERQKGYEQDLARAEGLLGSGSAEEAARRFGVLADALSERGTAFLSLRTRALARLARAERVRGLTWPCLRVTLDEDLRGRGGHRGLAFAPGDPLLFPEHLAVLEVKVSAGLPVWPRAALAGEDLVVRRWSKYCAAVDRRFGARGGPRALLAPPAHGPSTGPPAPP